MGHKELATSGASHVTDKFLAKPYLIAVMPRRARPQQTGDMHHVAFAFYDRQPALMRTAAKELFEQTLESVRQWYGFYISAYGVMPEHVHLLVSKPERGRLSLAMQMLQQ
jgi:REP element-mobilizing transposase RayT